MTPDPRQKAIQEHKRWLGYLQPEGLVVSPVALVDFNAQLDLDGLTALQERFQAVTPPHPDKGQRHIASFATFARDFLGWKDSLLDLYPVEATVPGTLTVSTGEHGEILRPDAAYRHLNPADPNKPWILLVRILPYGTPLDQSPDSKTTQGWIASPAQKLERLLRGTEVPIGLLCNGTELRLIHAPRGENSGSITFPVPFMAEIPGRAVVGALEMLLSHRRLNTVSEATRLPNLLKKSREYQSSVSEQLAEQVLMSLYELLRGFQAADEKTRGELLRAVIARNPNEIYEGLLNVLLRLVFLLFAEDRGLMPTGRLYARNYSVHGLFERLRADHEKHPDTMDSRFGGWAQLVTLFRLVHEGCRHPDLATPGRRGNLFDYNRFPFLEGRQRASDPIEGKKIPLVSDGVLYRVLEKLLLLDGERLSYRTLDVEEIGSVYQTIMGFSVQVVPGTAIALKGKRKNGGVPAAPVIFLDGLLAVSGKDRNKWLKEQADQELTGDADKALKAAVTVADALAALEKRIDRHATPAPVAEGGLVLQPTDERRRSGSHYTPRSFTRPIVQKTLEPILNRLGRHPKPADLLALKIADIAVGSAAFLVEVCRQLADELISAWHFHKCLPVIPPDEDEILHAMRTVAQRCLYGVDRNPMAVDLAKLSLWLATLAKDHPFTFLDHAIRCGDSLVGLTKKQIERFHWDDQAQAARQMELFSGEVEHRTKAALRERQALLATSDDFTSPALKSQKLKLADDSLDLVRLIGDTAIAAFFSADKDKAREVKRLELADRLAAYVTQKQLSLRPTEEVKALRSGPFPVIPFHWEIEFPEVFDRENSGFDGIVGNPPFLGGKRISTVSGESYRDWLAQAHSESNSNSDLVAHFFRHAYIMLRTNGCFGLIATNTIGQGDTRATGLRWICTNGGAIYAARKRYKWPGQAAVVVSVVWIAKSQMSGPFELDQRSVSFISAYLFHAGGNENPARLSANARKAFIGFLVNGMGFTFDDNNKKGIVSPIAEMNRLITSNSRNTERISPYIGGEEVNNSPVHAHNRFIINFGEMSESEARKWPDLIEIVEKNVRSERQGSNNPRIKKEWWLFEFRAPDYLDASQRLLRVIAIARVSQSAAFTFLPTGIVCSEQLVLFANDSLAFLAVLQARAHEIWARFFSSSMKDDLRYTPTDCFETFPFPRDFESNPALEAAGKEYYEFRAALMVDLWLGLTEVYNLFHAPDDDGLARLETLWAKRAADETWRSKEKVPDDRAPHTLYPTPATAHAAIQRLRALHAAMDAAVLTAYGWENLIPRCQCEFILDYEDDDTDESEAEPRKGRQKKKPWRYRWPDDVRDEVLARLLKLNADRAAEEKVAAKQAAIDAPIKTKKSGRKMAGPNPDSSAQATLKL